jgi:hypothetical protein
MSKRRTDAARHRDRGFASPRQNPRDHRASVTQEKNRMLERYGRKGLASNRNLAAMATAAVLWTTVVATIAPAETVDDLVKQQAEENAKSKTIQQRIDEIASDTEAMTAQYRASLQNARQLRMYNRQLEQLIDQQEKEMASLRRQVDEVTIVGRGVIPHMEQMIAMLEKFVELDMPFLREERRARVAELRTIMNRADVTISEKYRRILEAYQIENEYGRTIEAYRGSLGDGDGARTVDFLRVGRNALLYQTLDTDETGAWSADTQTWERMDDFRTSVRDGLRMARKYAAPDLIEVPMPAAEVLP